MTAEATKRPSPFRRVAAFLWDFLQRLESGGSGYHMDQTAYALARIRDLERDVADLKARRPN